jgi:hypothetical protein
MSSGCQHLDVVADVSASSDGCEDCLRTGDQWVHLRLCMSCGYVGCCDSSPTQHATAHWSGNRGHLIIRSYGSGEDWWWCYAARLGFDVDVDGAAPAPPHP